MTTTHAKTHITLTAIVMSEHKFSKPSIDVLQTPMPFFSQIVTYTNTEYVAFSDIFWTYT